MLWTGNKTTDDLIMAKRIADFEDQYQADAVFIDFGYGTGLKSIGDGWGRTWQLIPFGGGSTDPQMLNKRGEMFNACKTWLKLGGALDDQRLLMTCRRQNIKSGWTVRSSLSRRKISKSG